MHLGRQVVGLSEINFAFYLWLAKRRHEGREPLVRHAIPRQASEELIRIYNTITRADPDDNRLTRAVADGMDPDYFDARLAYLKKHLRAALGTRAARPYLVERFGRRPHSRYQLAIEPDRISLPEL